MNAERINNIVLFSIYKFNYQNTKKLMATKQDF